MKWSQPSATTIAPQKLFDCVKNDGTTLILLTGASGFIGENLLEDLLLKQHIVINIDNNPPRNASHKQFWHNVNINIIM